MVPDVVQEHYQMFIGGHWVDGQERRNIVVENPATAEPLSQVASAEVKDVLDAVASAKEAQKSWSRIDPQERARLVAKLGGMVENRIEDFARMDTLNAGHPIRAMRQDAKMAAEGLKRTAVMWETIKGESFPPSEGRVDFVLREPYGVVAAITPFNHPIHFACKKMGPALIAGNAVVLKPASATPVSTLELGRLVEKVLPPGVVNIIVGGGASAGVALVKHPDVRRITLTGGVSTGRQIMALASETLKYCTFELGGKNPMIVYPDADMHKAVKGAVDGMNFTATAGQSCESTSRLFLHEDIYEEFTKELVEEVSRIKVGLPIREETQMGALSHRNQYEKVLRYIEQGKAEGARLLTGGDRPRDPDLEKGYFVEPTVFDQVTNNMIVAREEIFGPVLSVLRWRDENTVLEQANDTFYGLTASIWTNNITNALTAAKRIDTAYVWINSSSKRYPSSPKAGHKQSGPGLEDLLSFTQVKNIDINLS
ncbi:MAG: aldehyde dehydrogenase family protein [Thaumarchaeota archaeon]|nr:aldehyde dehydrogenase family protein [Nitrososphaerota archaeon]